MKKKKLAFNRLTPKEWTILSNNVWSGVSSQREPHHKIHGATFPMALAERVIKIYTKKEDIVLDPFVGVGSTILAAYKLNRSAIGIDLSKQFCDISKSLLTKVEDNLFDKIKPKRIFYKIINDDVRNLKQYVKRNSIQLTFTSPPYANFIQRSVKDRENTHKKSLIKYSNKSSVKQYSNKKEDFGNLSYISFLKEIKRVLQDNLIITKDGGYSVWVVKDHRDTANKIPYIDFHSDLAKTAKEVGWYYHDLIVWDQNAQRSLVLLGYPTVFYSNQNCSFLVVLRKNSYA